MRILLVSQWFQPEPFYKGLPLAKALVERGHDVEVLTGFPNYPDGHVYPNYRVKPWQREVMEGIPVLRVALYPSHDASSAKRIANYISFATSSLAGALLGVKRPDVVLAYNLVTLAPTLRLLRTMYGCPVVLDVQDLWPESVMASGMLNLSRGQGLAWTLCDWAYRSADIILAQSIGMRRALIERGHREDRVEILYNWTEEATPVQADPDAALMEQLGLQDTFNVLFAGTMGRVQHLDSVLDAAVRVAEAAPHVRFLFVGGGIEVPALVKRTEVLGLRNVVFLPRQPRAEMGCIMSIAHVGLVHLQDEPLFRITIPSKTQAYFREGLPVLMAVEGNARELVETAGAGIGCTPCDPEALVAAIASMCQQSAENLRQMGVRGREFYERQMSFAVGMDRLNVTLQRAKDLRIQRFST